MKYLLLLAVLLCGCGNNPYKELDKQIERLHSNIARDGLVLKKPKYIVYAVTNNQVQQSVADLIQCLEPPFIAGEDIEIGELCWIDYATKMIYVIAADTLYNGEAPRKYQYPITLNGGTVVYCDSTWLRGQPYTTSPLDFPTTPDTTEFLDMLRDFTTYKSYPETTMVYCDSLGYGLVPVWVIINGGE